MNCCGIKRIQYPSRPATISVWLIADCHIGAANCEKNLLARDVARIQADPNSYWFGVGDYADYIGRRDKRFRSGGLDPCLTVADLGQLGHRQATMVRDTFYPIREKCLGLLMGNHEVSLQREQDQENLHGWVCTELGVQNLGYCCFKDLIFRRGVKDDGRDGWRLRFFLHHGRGSAATIGGKANTLQHFMNKFRADCYGIAHVHSELMFPDVQLGANAQCTELVEYVRRGAVTGSYSRTYMKSIDSSGYGEIAGYPPAVLGMVRFVIRPHAREFKVEA